MSQSLSDTYQRLVTVEPKFRGLLNTYGQVDPFAWHDGGRTGDSKFAAMALHITGQQISTRVAFTVFDRISDLVGGIPTAKRVANVDFDSLRSTGLSNAKTRYIQTLAQSQVSGSIDLEHMDDLEDTTIMAQLVAQPGIGVWSAEMFLIHQLHRPDVLPAGDIGIRRGVQQLWALDEAPSIRDTMARAGTWSPYRTYAAALLWKSLAPVGEISDAKEREIARETALTGRIRS